MNDRYDLNEKLLEQLTFHWERQARPRLDGLGDDEYHWEPVPGAWSLRPREEATTSLAAGAGDLVIDFEYPQPEPAPVTTIAWRLGHVIVGVFGERNAAHFGEPRVDYWSATWSPTAAGALAQLDDAYDRWVAGAGRSSTTWPRSRSCVTSGPTGTPPLLDKM